tara:strand:+ start:3687 stop:4262 length:576 start_codon:yes stop_codon:yes gene_type:complete
MVNRRLENSINDFGQKLVNLSAGNLQRRGKGGGNLESSLKYSINVNNDVYTLDFIMEDYGAFVDKGVSGAGGKIKTGKHAGTYDGINQYKNWKSEVLNTPFRFGSGRSSGSIYKGIGSFIRKKGLQPRNELGQFQTTVGLKIAMVKVLWTKGIKGISFFQNALRVTYKNFQNQFAKEFNLSVIDLIRKETR